MVIRKFLGHLALVSLVVACGGDETPKAEETDEDCGECVGSGQIFTASGGKMTATFEEASAGDKYVLMPYSVGDIKKISGALTPFSYKFPAATALAASVDSNVFSLLGHASSTPDMDQVRSDRAFLAKAVFGRWNPNQDIQAPGFWGLVKALEQHQAIIDQENGLNLFGDRRSLEEGFRRQLARRATERKFAKEPSLSKSIALTTADVACPEAGGSIYLPQKEGIEYVDIPDEADIVSDDNYCIIYMNDPKAETDKAAIKKSVETILSVYKDTIYKDQFPPQGTYTFKPHIVILETANAEYDLPDYYKTFLGLFASGPSDEDEAQYPLLYLASDLSTVENMKNNEDGAKAFHATLAHEIQHAISHYYRSHAHVESKLTDEPLPESVFVDEGIAHFMEDIFGYGAESFGDFAGNFLSVNRYGLYPFLGGSTFSTSENFNALRGGAQSLLYYLSSQKGGIEFTDGVVSGGGGLKFLVNSTKSAEQGAENLSIQFAHDKWSWVETMGNYLGALVLDNTSVKGVAKKYTTQEPFVGVTDLQGTSNKTFGMRFNKHSSLVDVTQAAEGEGYTPINGATQDWHYYYSRPILFEVKGSEDTYEVGLDDDIGSAISAVRIK